MKKALLKDSLKEIKNTYKRFISILLMALLGVGFFAGIRATSPDMVDTIDNYYKQQNVYDIEVVSTLGLTEEDVEEIKQVDGVKEVAPSFSKDVSLDIGDRQLIAKVHQIGSMNQAVLKSGRMPENSKECLVEESFIQYTGKQIGDLIQIQEEEEEKSFYEDELEIVGTAESPLYISRERGSSKLGSGKVNYFIYILKENINSEIYTGIYAKIENVNKVKTGSDNYEEKVEVIKENIEQIKEKAERRRYDELKEEANVKLTEAENEFKDKKQEAEEQIKQAEDELEVARAKIEEGEKELEQNEKKAKIEIANGKTKIREEKEKLEAAQKELDEKTKQAEEQFTQVEELKLQQKQNLESVTTTLENVNIQYQNVLTQLQNTQELTLEQIQALQIQKQTLEQTIKELERNKLLLSQAISKMEAEFTKGKGELQDAQLQVTAGKSELGKQEQILQTIEKQTNAKLQKANE